MFEKINNKYYAYYIYKVEAIIRKIKISNTSFPWIVNYEQIYKIVINNYNVIQNCTLLK